MKTTTALKSLLAGSELSFVMEAHNALSAKIAEQAGFKAIWASGLTISASLGLSDRNEASWTQVVEIAEHMAESVKVPVLVDGDSGFGNFNNVSRLVKKLSQRGIAGVCLEDKLFPKQNSFIGEGQALENVQEFCAKICAAKDSQVDEDFCVIARVEALIANHPMEEALQRAEAYSNAGADAILIHSKKSSGDEIIEFAKRWNNRCPVVIVPTKYHKRPTQDFADNGISTIIWANHSLRASITAMQSVTREIMLEQKISGVEDSIASLQTVFELTNEYAVQEAEKQYFKEKQDVA